MIDRRKLWQFFSTLGIVSCLQLTFSAIPAAAGDPFRDRSPHQIGQNTEAAFKSLFIGGDYPQARNYLEQAQKRENNDPLVYSMLASLAYIDEDWEGLGDHGTQTREVAEALVSTDALRGNLYIAVGHFLEGAYHASKYGAVRGAPQALNKLQDALKYLKKAEAIASDDPELNLVKGYMDLMLSVVLPFADTEQAIERLENLARPQYLTYRGIAMAYRDLEDYQNALTYVNRAMEVTPNHPEIHYLKAQILHKLGQSQAAKNSFNKALSRPQILPKYLVAQIFFEACKNQRKLDQRPRNCDALRDPIKQGNRLWGPATLPSLD